MAHEPQSFVEGPDELRARLARVKAVLAAHKLRFPRGSRFARFEKLAERFAAKTLGPQGPGSRRDVDLLLDGNRDFADLATIVAHLFPTTDPGLLHKVRQVFGGTAFTRCDD